MQIRRQLTELSLGVSHHDSRPRCGSIKCHKAWLPHYALSKLVWPIALI